jgi:hypothetical protein
MGILGITGFAISTPLIRDAPLQLACSDVPVHLFYCNALPACFFLVCTSYAAPLSSYFVSVCTCSVCGVHPGCSSSQRFNLCCTTPPTRPALVHTQYCWKETKAFAKMQRLSMLKLVRSPPKNELTLEHLYYTSDPISYQASPFLWHASTYAILLVRAIWYLCALNVKGNT